MESLSEFDISYDLTNATGNLGSFSNVITYTLNHTNGDVITLDGIESLTIGENDYFHLRNNGVFDSILNI